MPIKNYTSNVDSYTSLGELQGALARGGATRILINYDGGKPIGVMFSLQNERGIMNFALPANVEGVLEVFRNQKVSANRDQAERTAWRNIRDWVLAQMAFIESGAVKMDEVFLPYLTDGNRTIYQLYKSGQLLLPEGK
jgi:hypothetical protein